MASININQINIIIKKSTVDFFKSGLGVAPSIIHFITMAGRCVSKMDLLATARQEKVCWHARGDRSRNHAGSTEEAHPHAGGSL